MRVSIFILLIIGIVSNIKGQGKYFVIADSISIQPLPSASIFDHKGNLLGICNNKGKSPYIHNTDLPVIVRYMGYKEKEIRDLKRDTIFLLATES